MVKVFIELSIVNYRRKTIGINYLQGMLLFSLSKEVKRKANFTWHHINKRKQNKAS